MSPDCDLCSDTGWITCVDYDDSGYEVLCPEGCIPPTFQDAESDLDAEVPF